MMDEAGQPPEIGIPLIVGDRQILRIFIMI